MSASRKGIPALARWWHKLVGTDEAATTPPAAGRPAQEIMFAGPTSGALAAFLALRSMGLLPPSEVTPRRTR